MTGWEEAALQRSDLKRIHCSWLPERRSDPVSVPESGKDQTQVFFQVLRRCSWLDPSQTLKVTSARVIERNTAQQVASLYWSSSRYEDNRKIRILAHLSPESLRQLFFFFFWHSFLHLIPADTTPLANLNALALWMNGGEKGRKRPVRQKRLCCRSQWKSKKYQPPGSKVHALTAETAARGKTQAAKPTRSPEVINKTPISSKMTHAGRKKSSARTSPRRAGRAPHRDYVQSAALGRYYGTNRASV